jgi:hypothetical protein
MVARGLIGFGLNPWSDIAVFLSSAGHYWGLVLASVEP